MNRRRLKLKIYSSQTAIIMNWVKNKSSQTKCAFQGKNKKGLKKSEKSSYPSKAISQIARPKKLLIMIYYSE